MKVLMIFSRYRQHGGEEQSTKTETELLRSEDHEVELLAIRSPLRAGAEIASALRSFRPDIVHIQNFFPSIQPRHYEAIRDFGCPIVQSLRNYRLTCVTANQWRDDRGCNECSFANHRPAIVHGCYRGSRAQSAVAVSLLRSHRRHASWTSDVSAFIAVSEHVRDSVQPWVGDVPIFVKPNTVITDIAGTGSARNIVYAGRLSPEKGILKLAETWSRHAEFPELVVIGTGPDGVAIEELACRAANITVLGPLSHDATLRHMADAVATIVPWRWNEPFGRTLMESLAVGTPVIASPEAAKNFRGLGVAVVTFDLVPGDFLGEAVSTISADGAAAREQARSTFQQQFAPALNLTLLTGVYESCLGY